MRRIAALFALILPLVAITPSYARPLAETPTTNTITQTVSGPGVLSSDYSSRLASDRFGISRTFLLDGSILLAGGSYGTNSCSVPSSDIYNTAVGQIEQVGDMLYSELVVSTSLLEDGRVLFKTRNDDCDYEPEEPPHSQLYNPATRSFEPTPSYIPRRALYLGNGGVVAYSGQDIQFCRPLANFCAMAGRLITTRTNFTATLLANGDVLITGGTDSLTNAEIYRPSTGAVSLVGTPSIDIKAPGLVLQDGRVFFSENYSNGTSYADIYEPQTQTFTLTARHTSGVFGPKGRTFDGKVVILTEGDRLTLYDPESDTFSSYPYGDYVSGFPSDSIALPNAEFLFVNDNYRAYGNYVVRNSYKSTTFTGSLTYPTSWVQKQTIKVAVRASSTGSFITQVGLQTSYPGGSPITAWTPYSTTVSPTIDLLQEGRNRPVTLLLQDSSGNIFTFGTGYVNLDLTAPVSQMAQLPAYSRKDIVLNWSGSDPLSGIEGYAVEMRVGTDGVWQRIARDITKTSVGASGTQGQQLFFRVRARDVAGNVEAWPTDYDTQTTIDTVGPTGVLDVSFVGDGSVQVLVASKDTQSGTQDMRVGFSYNFDQAGWEPYQTSKTLTRLGAPAGCLRVYGQFRDHAGNVGPVIQATVPGTGCPAQSNTVYLPLVRR